MKITKKVKHYFKRIRKISQLEKENSKMVIKSLGELNRIPLLFEPSQNPKISIIIAFCNQENFTWNCLISLNRHLTNDIPFEILLIDDNSTQSTDFSLIKGIAIHKNNETLGFLKSLNKGIKLAKGEYIYTLNNDTEVQENFLKELYSVFENFKNVGAVGSKLINPNGKLQTTGSVFKKGANSKPICINKKDYYPEINYVVRVDYCSVCSLLFKKTDNNGNINLFDEQFSPALFEEKDFCLILKQIQKKEIYYTPFSRVIHYNDKTYNSSKSKVLLKNNSEKFHRKWDKQLEKIKSTSIESRIQENYYKSIIFFNGIIPEFDKDSGSNRLKEIMKSYIELGYHVSLVCQSVYKDNDYIPYYQKLGVNVFYEHKMFAGFKMYLINQKIRASIVWFYGPLQFSNFYKAIKRRMPKAKLIFDMVDIHFLRYERVIKLEPNRISHRRKYRKYFEIETKLAQDANYIITISDVEKKIMSKYVNPDKLITISNIHYPKIKKEDTLSFEERKDLLFIGSTHTPNIDALYYLYNDIMPIVWEKSPDIKVIVIGNVSGKISDINHPQFIFKGYVPDIEPFLISSKIMIAPLRYGAGVKGKVGQAFEYYLPVVTTSIGAEGMKLTNHINALINDTKEGFANSIIDLYTNKNLWVQLQNNSEKSLEPFSKEILKQTLFCF